VSLLCRFGWIICAPWRRERAAPIVSRIRQIGVDRILYGSDGAAGPDRAPKAAWQSFTELPLKVAEIRAVAENVAPCMR
jgi:predicted TIM-barrel fold metal-dependent hydrolase